ncbi:MAG: aminotransferase class III-fold pyridoxal phosphate-dependent enzyme, partial [Paramuribaculum sp.]|nr:aminotransferase class III-fold pyridoxal phosphate-dependent enzyme [Paramuribaculum sp.]
WGAAIGVRSGIEQEKLVDNAREVGAYLLDRLREIPRVKNPRGRGLMIGFEVEGMKGADVRRSLLFDYHIFTGGASPDTVRLLPALCLSIEEAKEFIDSLTRLLDKQ